MRNRPLMSQLLYGAKYQASGSSKSVSIAVGSATAHIVSFDIVPNPAAQGENLRGVVNIQNTGDTDATMDVEFFRINPPPQGDIAELGWAGRQSVPAGQSKVFAFDPLIQGGMPSGDSWFSARSHVSGFWPWDAGPQSEFSDKMVDILLTVATTLTLSVSPTNVVKGATIQCTGKLTRNDNSNGIANQSLSIAILNGVGNIVTSTTTSTDSSGNYSTTLTAPTTAGSYTVQTTYSPSGLLGQTVSESLVVSQSYGSPWRPTPPLLINNYARARNLGLMNLQRRMEEMAVRQGYVLS